MNFGRCNLDIYSQAVKSKAENQIKRMGEWCKILDMVWSKLISGENWSDFFLKKNDS